MLYLYLDESGDLGFDFVNKKPSRFFVETILLVSSEDDRSKICTGIKRTLKKMPNPKGKRQRMVRELNGSDTTLAIKQYFYRQVETTGFSILSIVLNKKRVYEHLTKDKSRVYNWITRLVLDKIDFSQAHQRVVLVLDKSKGKREIEEFNQYVRRQLESKIDPHVPFEIRHENSCQDYCLNAVDLFAWGIFRKHEKRDSAWRDIYQGKIKEEVLYLP